VLWVHELVGSTVVDEDGVELGVVTGLLANPASDLLELADGSLRTLPVRELTITRPLMMVERESAQMEPAAAAFVHLLQQSNDAST
ncbi:MAG: hypothetical protein M0038_11975, partial [Pseudomonadota bacterium]|jgi:ribosomal 30S subunit maturation factor RimM|nr:hypothetical protein [Pseudomonadota bacterium]